jgi:hypothetical protein
MSHFHRICAHPSTRACLPVLVLYAAWACLNVYQYLRSVP